MSTQEHVAASRPTAAGGRPKRKAALRSTARLSMLANAAEAQDRGESSPDKAEHEANAQHSGPVAGHPGHHGVIPMSRMLYPNYLARMPPHLVGEMGRPPPQQMMSYEQSAAQHAPPQGAYGAQAGGAPPGWPMEGYPSQGPGGWMPHPYGYPLGFQPGIPPPPFGPGAAMYPGMPYPWMGGSMQFPQYPGDAGANGDGGRRGPAADPASAEGGYGQPPPHPGMPPGMPYPAHPMYGMGGPQYMQYPMMQQPPSYPAPHTMARPPPGSYPHGIASSGPAVEACEQGGRMQAAGGSAAVGPTTTTLPPEAVQPTPTPVAAVGDTDGGWEGGVQQPGADPGAKGGHLSSAATSVQGATPADVVAKSSLYTAQASSLTLSVPTGPDEVAFGWVWRSQGRAGRWHTFLRQAWGGAPVIVRPKGSVLDQAMHFHIGSTAPVPEAVFFHWLHRCRRTYLNDLIRVHLTQRRNGVASREVAVITGDAIHVLCEIARATVLRSNRGYLALPRTPVAIRAFETALRDALRPQQPLVADVVGVPQLEARPLQFDASGQGSGSEDGGVETGQAGRAPGDSDGSISVSGGGVGGEATTVPESGVDSAAPHTAGDSSTAERAAPSEGAGGPRAHGRRAALQDSAHAGGIDTEAPARTDRARADEEVARAGDSAGVSSPDSDHGGLSRWDTSEHTFVRQGEHAPSPLHGDASARKRGREGDVGGGSGGEGDAVDTAGTAGVHADGSSWGNGVEGGMPAAKRPRPEAGVGPETGTDGWHGGLERRDSVGSATASSAGDGADDGWDSEDDAVSASGRDPRWSGPVQVISASEVVWSHPALDAAAFASVDDASVPGTLRSILDSPTPAQGARPEYAPGPEGAGPVGQPQPDPGAPKAAAAAAEPASESWGARDAVPMAEAEVWSTAGSDPGSVSTSIGDAAAMGSVIGPIPHVPPRASEQWTLSPARPADASRSMRELRLQLTQSLWRRCDYQDAKLKLIVNLFADEFALWGIMPHLKRVRKHDTQQLLYSMLVLLHPGDADLVTAMDHVRGKLLSTAYLAAHGEIAAVMRDQRRRIQLAQSIIGDTPPQLVTAVARALSQKSKLADSVLRGLAEALQPVLGEGAI